ncbi:MAG: YraN family protein [Bacteroidia bacterium]
MPSRRQKTGHAAEKLAAAFLQKQGYHIVAQNWRWGNWEIDLIAQKEEEWVFVEVRSLSAHLQTYPENTLSPKKQQTLLQAVDTYLRIHFDPIPPARIDVIAIVWHPDKPPEITHYPDSIH